MDINEKELPETPRWVRFGNQVRENVQILAIALSLALLIRIFVAEPRYIPSESMLPTLQVGDRLIVEKISYRFHPPAKGDIIVFEPPAPLQTKLELEGYGKDQAFIKRVIGEPGQQVSVKNGKVYINQKPLDEKYIAEPPNYQWPLIEGPSIEVPENNLFVMGDNRNNSRDSHVWGFLPKQNVIGRAFFRFWPLNRIGLFG
ncbi:signal peptidase I [Microseira wollei]|uniref:Signal peptidase I n=1 Tax=Microseira wollei NIES-4236 TaxID=2530354 RepID=A0AAV3XSF4_9CYAN|nr:signal peptidase I [Microseira wollei]GET42777.1 leader peptidase I [Microseira wollei NIES-4236]